MKRRFDKPDPTGRSTPHKADPGQGPKVWAGKPWTSLSSELMESPAWRAMSDIGRRVLDRIILEHTIHRGTNNGEIVVTYGDFVQWGIRRSSVALGVAECISLGLVERPDRGHRAYGTFKGRPARFRLTWFATRDGSAPTNSWKRFRTLPEARQVAKRARDDIKAKRGKRTGVELPAIRRCASAAE